MKNLPVEIVTHVMGFLSKSDREEAALVSKAWYEASLDPCLHTRTVTKLKASTATSARIRSLAHRKSPHLVVLFVDGAAGTDWVIREIGFHLGPHLKTLSLYGCDVTEKMFIEIIRHCSNVQSLDLSCCNPLFMTGNFLNDTKSRDVVGGALKKLKQLKLNSIRYLSDVLLNRLLECCPHLEGLSLAGCNIAFETDPCDKENKEAVSFVTFSNLKVFFKKQASILRSLDLSNTSVTSRALADLCSIPNLGLKSIILDRCTSVSDKGLVALATSAMNLELLSFTKCDSISSTAIAALAENMPSLQCLKFSGVRVLPDHVTASLFSKLPDLTSLSISCFDLKPKGITLGLSSVNHCALTKLDVGGSAIDDKAISALAKSSPNLQELSVQSCPYISDISVIIISRSFADLRKLNLSWCMSITDFGILGLDKDTPRLAPKEKLHYSDRFTRSHSQMGFFTVPNFKETIQLVSEKELMTVCDSREFEGLSQLRKLEYLDLSNCSHLTDVSMERGLSFPHLSNLQLAFCRNLTDQGFAWIAQSNPSLEVLNIAQCHLLTNDGLQSLVSSLRSLVRLNLAGCSKLGNKSLELIANVCKRLQSVDLSLCGMVSIGAIKKMQQVIPTLQEVEFGHTGSYLAPLSHPDFF